METNEEKTKSKVVATIEEQVDETDDLAPEELELLEGDARKPRSSLEEDSQELPSPTEPPDWVMLPKSIKFPPVGCQVAFLRVPAKWCRDPSKGDRQCILWMLDERDEEQAFHRCRGDQMRSVHELTKGTIRAIDGMVSHWTGENNVGNVNRFWRDVGPKGRSMLRNYYVRTHAVDADESVDFFSRHFALVTVQKA